MDRRNETKIVKDALRARGVPVKRVRHGTGTAWGWLRVYADRREGVDWQADRQEILSIVLAATGRSGDYNGRVIVLQDHDNVCL